MKKDQSTQSLPKVRPPDPIDKFELKMEVEAYKRMREYVDQCPDEIQGFGVVSVDKNLLLVHKIFIIPQEVSSVDTEIDESDMHRLLEYAVENDIDPQTIKFWWHSHVNMSVFWSGTDTTMLNTWQNGWMVSLVTNKRREYKSRLDVYSPFRQMFELSSPKLFFDEDKAMKEEVKKEIYDKVKRSRPTMAADGCVFPGQGDFGYNGLGGWRDWEQYGGSARQNGNRGILPGSRGTDGGVGRGQRGGTQSSNSVVRGAGHWQEKSRRASGTR